MARAKKKPGKPGRPSLYSEALADKLCDLIAEGRSLRAICKLQGMPDLKTIMRWLGDEEKHPGFASKYACARELQADMMDDRILETAERTNAKNAVANRVKIDAYKWRASKLKPKVYGDKLEHRGHVTLGLEALVAGEDV